MDMGYIAALGSELVNDPQTLGYVPHVQANWQDEGNAAADLALLTAQNVTLERKTLSGSEIFEAIDDTEWQARSADQKDDIKFVVSLGDTIQISSGTKARTMLARALTGATNSLANLQALVEYTGSRADQLAESTGYGQFSGVKLGQIQLARREQP